MATGFSTRIQPIIYMYSKGAPSPGGNLGDRATTTARCQAEHSLTYASLECTNFAALLSYGAADNAIDILTNYSFDDGLIQSHNGTLIANQWAELFDDMADEENLVDAGVLLSAPSLWVGFNNATPSSDNCMNWTSSSPSDFGAFGQGNSATGRIQTLGTSNCNSVTIEYVCLCQK